MCGIIGIFNHPAAGHKIKEALALLRNRGRDGVGIATLSEVYYGQQEGDLPSIQSNQILGHTLHAVVNHISQPLRGQGLLTANCEIYNWQELAARYHFSAQNDADFLLQFLGVYYLDRIGEIDGVYAFAYWRDDQVYLARDIIGEKPLWFSHENDSFAFASEKKVLEKIGFTSVQELNPRSILIYTISRNSVTTVPRPFFQYQLEHQESFEEIKEKTAVLLDQAIAKRIPQQKFGLLFSGGVDSTFLAHYFREHGYNFTCYTAVLDTDQVEPSDLRAAQEAAEKLGLDLRIKKIKIDDIPSYLKKIIPLIEDSNVVKVGVALTFYLACEMAKEDGCKVIFSGLGSEEIFAGYERHKHSANINQECVSGLLKMYERDLYRDDVLTMDNHLELRLPFLDLELVKYALKIPEKCKISENGGKYIFRLLAEERGLPPEIAFRKKTAAQYGSRFDYALGKLATKNGFPSKSAYLSPFYPHANVKLGVLFSSGKDSTAAAYIMKQQNYELACLITLKSQNPDSYMFQTAGTELVTLQAEAMNLPLIIQETVGEKEEELADLETALRCAQKEHSIQGVVSGALFSTYQRDRIEKICDQLGLKIFSPLWHKSQDQHMEELLRAGFKMIFTAVAAEGLDQTWLNREITLRDIITLKKLHASVKLNVAGEGGEFESAVLDCPLFTQKIIIDGAEIVEHDQHSARLLIQQAHLEPK